LLISKSNKALVDGGFVTMHWLKLTLPDDTQIHVNLALALSMQRDTDRHLTAITMATPSGDHLYALFVKEVPQDILDRAGVALR
jgi:hypothetical protein